MISIPIRGRMWLGASLIALVAACGGPSTPPSVKLTATPTSLEDGQTVTLKAEVTGAGKMVVDFFKGSEKVATDDSAPYEASLVLTANDNTTLDFSAKATDANKLSGTSSVVKVEVKVDKEAPQVELSVSSPKLNSAGSITLMAKASDNKGVVKVEFYKSAAKIGETSSATGGVYSLNVPLTAGDNGNQQYTAKAFDAKGNVGTAQATVEVDIDDTAPVVSLSSNKTTVTSAGSATLTADASDNKGVSKVEFYKGSDKIAEDSEAPYTHDLSFTAANNGTHTYSAKAHDAKGNIGTSASVSIVVDIDQDKPIVALQANPTSLGAPGSTTLSASAQDANGIAKVEFYKGSEKIGEDTEAPYTHQVSYLGDYNATDSFSARAFDSRGNSADSDAVSVVVDIDITNPSIALSPSSSNVTNPGPVSLNANANDNRGVTKVEFYKGTSKIGEDTTAPFSFEVNFTSADNGSHTYSAKAFDAKGNSATSDDATVVVNIDVTLPTVSLSADKSILSVAGPVVLSANASDDLGVTKVEFYRNGVKLGEDTSAPFEWTYTYPNLSYITFDDFSAKAFDAQNNSGTSNTVSIELDIDIDAPVWTSLDASNTNVTAPGSVTLTGVAVDNKAISKIEFFKNEGSEQTLIGTDTDGSNGYTTTLSFDAEDNGVHKYQAKAWDTRNNGNASGVREITVAILPDIDSFSGSTSSLPVEGGSVDLSWDGDFVKDYSLSVSPSAGVTGMPDGTTTDTSISGIGLPANTTASPIEYTFTLTANGYGSVTADTATVKVTVDPVTVGKLNVSIEGLPSPLGPLAEGGNADVDVEGPDYENNLSESELLENLEPGSYTITPNNVTVGNVTYTATGSTKEVAAAETSEATVDYNPNAPVISSFTTDDDSFDYQAGSITLSWAASDTNDYSLSVEPSEGVSGMPEGNTTDTSASITLPQNNGMEPIEYTFTLKANGDEELSDSKTVKVTVGPRPAEITSFYRADSNTLSDAGGSVNLAWEATNVTSYELAVSPSEGVSGMPEGSMEASEVSRTITLPANPTNAAKVYTFTLTANGPEGTTADTDNSVSVTIAPDTTAPSVDSFSSTKTLISTAQNDGSKITLSATASDFHGVSKVEFWDGATKLGEVAEAPYTWDITHSFASNGNHPYVAKAIDAAGNVGSSSVVNVFVNIDGVAPTISLSSDKAGLAAPGTAFLTATVFDAVGVTKVEFWEGSVLVGSDTSSTGGWNLGIHYIANNEGDHTYTAKAFDAEGNNTTSGPVTVRVDNTAPTDAAISTNRTCVRKAFTNPTFTLTGTALDNLGLSKMEFYEGTTKVGEDTNPSGGWTLTLQANSISNGNHTYTAKAIDYGGNSMVSDNSVTVEIRGFSDTACP